MQLGDTVRWKSQAKGSWKEKVGVIVEVVAPRRIPDKQYWKKLFRGYGPSCWRPKESYVVTVGKAVYWPVVSKLEKV
jgi:hypothetical protein